jgi:hypothetical protein
MTEKKSERGKFQMNAAAFDGRKSKPDPSMRVKEIHLLSWFVQARLRCADAVSAAFSRFS